MWLIGMGADVLGNLSSMEILDCESNYHISILPKLLALSLASSVHTNQLGQMRDTMNLKEGWAHYSKPLALRVLDF